MLQDMLINIIKNLCLKITLLKLPQHIKQLAKPMMNICYFDLLEDTSVEFYLNKSTIIQKSIQICCQQNIKPEYVRNHKYNFL